MKGPNQNDRSGNAKSTKDNIHRTQQNIEFAKELMARLEDEGLKNNLDEENRRREQALVQLKQAEKEQAKHHKP